MSHDEVRRQGQNLVYRLLVAIKQREHQSGRRSALLGDRLHLTYKATVTVPRSVIVVSEDAGLFDNPRAASRSHGRFTDTEFFKVGEAKTS